VVMVEKVVVMNCHVQQKVKVGKTVCDEASVVPWEVHSRDKVRCIRHYLDSSTACTISTSIVRFF